MWNERILWAILVALLSKLFLSPSTLRQYVAWGIIIILSCTLMFLKPYQLMRETQDGSRSSSSSPEVQGSRSGGFFHKARNFVINNPIMTYIQGEDKTPRIMELLANHIIVGAAHDDSARNYPPKCHPGTRIKILERLSTWFHDINRVKSIFWLSGPAGVGKSAIIQTFAESIGQPVASVFVSRPNKRNDPNRIFITIASQLAVRIDAYRNYIVDRLAVNPYLLNKSIQVQFEAFITEPFVERKIGAGGTPLAILLDGLDEVDGAAAQRDIIRLISTFTQDHPDAPLAWIIASRPEPHIANTFNEATIQDRFEPEFIPIDSPEACQDVEHFLRDSFSTIRREFPNTTSTNWPEETALTKLAAAASGLFIFAETAIRFIRDPDHAHPIPRLKLVLSVIDRSKGISVGERPFALLDDLYTEILSNIPSGLLPTTKLLLRMTLSFRDDNFLGLLLRSKSRTLRGMTMILQLDHHTVYAALSKCFSMLNIPPWEEAHKKTLTFLHASFADYLADLERSGKFYIDIDGAEDDVLLFYLQLWHERFGEKITSSVNSVDGHDDDTQQITPEDIDRFNSGVLKDMARSLVFQVVERHKPHPEVSPASQQKRLECLNYLRKVNMISLCSSGYLTADHSFFSPHSVRSLFSFAKVTFKAWKDFPHELCESGVLRQVSFKDINFDYRDKEAYKVVERKHFPDIANLFVKSYDEGQEESVPSFLERSPDLPVLICGTVPQGRVALFKGNNEGTKYCIAPYRE